MNDKKEAGSNFGNPMGSFDGAPLSEFLGSLLLHNLNNIIAKWTMVFI